MFDEYLKTFICASECGSFTKAAETLFLSPNAVKKRIKTLEESIGFLLFERNLKGMGIRETVLMTNLEDEEFYKKRGFHRSRGVIYMGKEM